MTSKLAKRIIGKTRSKRKQKSMYKLKLTLVGAPVPIWRRVVIRGDTALNVVHDIFQITMGWWETHLHDFHAGDKRYGNLRTADGDLSFNDETKFVLADLINAPGDSFKYVYDFGDGWMHEAVLESVLEADGDGFVLCLGGRRACPPEDVGGVPGYMHFLNVVEDPEHEQRDEMLAWAGGSFDADSFDIRGVNLRLLLLQEALMQPNQ
ncbi:MAG: plasmid pRiA4b ORF-3 family protein [Candidatus Obscuribacterales bacterium]|nr:plasmid pRiA4b ORF-3 family protein [Candidatus Obscuribacterales bacterium]